MAKASEKKSNSKQGSLDLLLKEEVFKAIMDEDIPKTTQYEILFKDNEVVLVTTIEQKLDLGKIKKPAKPKKNKNEESKSLIESLAPPNPEKRKRKSINLTSTENKKSPKKQNVSKD